MYKPSDKQTNFFNFNQPVGLHMNPDNRWIKMADSVPWDELEKRYAKRFKSKTGNVAKPLRMALGSLIIQTRYQYSDRELVEQLRENPYYQYFIGLPGYQEGLPFVASLLVFFRKRISADLLSEANEHMLNAMKSEESDIHQDDENHPSAPSTKTEEEAASATQPENEGTLMLDATCAPSHIRYPQDFSLLNEAREKLEKIIGRICKSKGLKKPRTYCKKARKNYLALAKNKKRSVKKIRATIKKQLSYVRRDLGYVDAYIADGHELSNREKQLLSTIRDLYEQQLYMYQSKTHSVANRIVSIAQPYLRPIVRGKSKAPVEFGAKLDLSLDSEGYGRIEKVSFDAYNESTGLMDAIERFKERTGHYPERVLVDQIYRTRSNREYCKQYHIRMSGPKLGRPSLTAMADKKTEYRDNTDRIEVERAFSLSKRCYGLGLIRAKLEETTLTSIALSIFVTNLFKVQSRIFFVLYKLLNLRGWNTAGRCWA